MPTTTTEFFIEHVPEGMPTFASCVHLSDTEDFWRIADLGFIEEMHLKHGEAGGRICVSADAQDPRLVTVFDILGKHGYYPARRALVTVAGRECQFQVKRHRKYARSEIASAALLMLRPRFCKDIIANWFGGSDTEGWAAKADNRLHNDELEMGHFDSFEAILLGARLRDILLQSRMKGLELLSVQFDHPELASRQLWQFGHQIVLPPCLLPRQGVDRLDYVEGEPNGAYWDDQGYNPPELRFEAKAIATMGAFDVARSREKIGFHSAHYRSEVIVSQKFREVLESAQINTVEYVPVRLIE